MIHKWVSVDADARVDGQRPSLELQENLADSTKSLSGKKYENLLSLPRWTKS